jgi:hypothetical protein
VTYAVYFPSYYLRNAARGFTSDEVCPAPSLQLFDDLSDILNMLMRHHEDGISGVNDYHVIEANRRNQTVSGPYNTASAIDHDRVSLDEVALGITLEALGPLIPRANIAPAELLGVHHHAVFGML